MRIPRNKIVLFLLNLLAFCVEVFRGCLLFLDLAESFKGLETTIVNSPHNILFEILSDFSFICFVLYIINKSSILLSGGCSNDSRLHIVQNTPPSKFEVEFVQLFPESM